jgi:hypothetical protein
MFKTGSGHVGFCDGQKWRWGQVFSENFGFPANLHSICFSTIIFIITQGWHNRPGLATVPIASQSRIKKKKIKNIGENKKCLMIFMKFFHIKQ